LYHEKKSGVNTIYLNKTLDSEIESL
jgi:hypothetical protein